MGTVTLTHDVTNETVRDPSLDGDIMDTRMDEVSPNTNSGAIAWILVGETTVKSTQEIAICYYDMAQVIPKDAGISHAEWWIYIEGYAIGLLTTFEAFRIRRNGQASSGPGSTLWVESECTWNDANSGTPWGTPGALHIVDDYDPLVTDELTGLDIGESGTSDVAVTTTDTTLKDTRKIWSNDEWNGFTVQCNGKKMLITDTYQDGGDWVVEGSGWSGGGNPGNGFSYIIQTIGFMWNPSLINIVRDAQNNQNGKVHFKAVRTDSLSITQWFQYSSKEVVAGDFRRPHLRVTYELDSKTFQANVY